MRRPLPDIVATTADRLGEWLKGATTENEVLHILWLWARENGAQRSPAGHSDSTVYLTADVVVKFNRTFSPIDHIPEAYRPEQAEVWSGVDRSVWVQPRYETVADEFRAPIGDRLQRLSEQVPFWAEIGADSHRGNWGLRADGSPVLFDW